MHKQTCCSLLAFAACHQILMAGNSLFSLRWILFQAVWRHAAGGNTMRRFCVSQPVSGRQPAGHDAQSIFLFALLKLAECHMACLGLDPGPIDCEAAATTSLYTSFFAYVLCKGTLASLHLLLRHVRSCLTCSTRVCFEPNKLCSSCGACGYRSTVDQEQLTIPSG